jgi:opacity protein-like surface antigen
MQLSTVARYFILLSVVNTAVVADNFFINANFGVAQNSAENTSFTLPSRPGVKTIQLLPLAINGSTPLWGIGGGYQWNIRQWSFAPEIIFDQTSASVDKNPALQPPPIPIENSFSSSLVANNIFLNAKLGYQFYTAWSAYLLAGFGESFISAKGTFNFNYPPLPAGDVQTNNVMNTAWQMGGGVDYTLTPRWQVGAGIIYRNYGKVPLGTFYANPPVTNGFPINYANYSALLLNFTLTFHFVSSQMASTPTEISSAINTTSISRSLAANLPKPAWQH